MDVSRFNAKVVFEKRAIIADNYGNTIGDWTTTYDDQAEAVSIRPRLGGEEVLAARLAGRQIVTMTVRSSTRTRAVTTDWRARNVRNGTIYNIRSIVDPNEHTSERGRYLEMICEAGVAT